MDQCSYESDFNMRPNAEEGLRLITLRLGEAYRVLFSVDCTSSLIILQLVQKSCMRSSIGNSY